VQDIVAHACDARLKKPLPLYQNCECTVAFGLLQLLWPLRTAMQAAGSLAEAFAWPSQCLALLRSKFGDEVLARFRRNLRSATVSTAFSGIGAPEVALSFWHAAVDGMFGQDVRHEGQLLYSVELTEEARTELSMLECPAVCSFADITSFINPAIKSSVINRASTFSLAELERIFMQHNVVVESSHCTRHGRRCTAQRALLHIAGPPCVDWSAQGVGLGVLGPTMVAFMVWVAASLASCICVCVFVHACVCVSLRLCKRLVVDVEGGSHKLKGINNTQFGKAMLPARGNQLQACQAGPEDRCGKCI